MSGGISSAVRLYFGGKYVDGQVISGIGYDTGNGLTYTFLKDFYAYPQVVVTSGTDTSGMVIKPQLDLGSTATDYEPYNGTSYTTTLGRTVYGGTLDVVSGLLTVDRAMVDLGSLNYGYNATGRFYNTTSIQNFKRATTTAERATGLVCSAYSPSSTLSFSDAQDDFSWLRAQDSNTYDLIIKDTHYTTTADFKTAMDGVQLVYELAQPQTYQLTPQEVDLILGTNNLWCDSGNIEVNYYADIQKYIDKKLS